MTRPDQRPNVAAAIRNLGDRHLYLAGYRGSGKSTVGRAIAEQLGRTWIDLDDEIETTQGRSISDIFADGGESTFRDLEEAALASVAEEAPAVISLGGGAVLRDSNRRQIAASGVCVWLQIDAQTVLSRLTSDSTTAKRRPALTTLPPRQEVESLLAMREPLYRQVADVRVDTVGRSLDEIVNDIFARFAHSAGGDRGAGAAGNDRGTGDATSEPTVR
jgi:shikimate kinase